jgi:hypothetical protein
MQSRFMSGVETVASTGIGFAVALLTQILVFPLFNLHPSLGENIAITWIFTGVSLLRGYAVRRLFARLHK